MTYHQKSSSPNFNKIFDKQLLTPDQVQKASILELRSNPLLWAAFKRGWDENFSKNQENYDFNFPDNNDSLYDANCQQNKNVREDSMNKNKFSQQYRLQKTVIITPTNCKSDQIESMETDN